MLNLKKLEGMEVAVCWGADSVIAVAMNEDCPQGVKAMLVRGILELHPNGIMCRVVSEGGAAFFNIGDADSIVDGADLGPFTTLPVITIKENALTNLPTPKWLN